MGERPSIFVSSTIYDFQDLRSSLQYWLNEFGFEVRMSDRNDFIKDSSVNSYQACLESIAECDYYLLLIGSRVGGSYSQTPKISITQKEYQYANKLAENGKIKKLFVFVRKNLWDIKEDRKGLEKLLKSEYEQDNELSEEKRDLIAKSLYHSSRFVNDANFIFSFIEEVSKSKQMKEATTGETIEFPTHNWINIFSDFKDIIDVLKAELRIDFSLSRKKWGELICENLSTVLSSFLTKNVSGAITAYCYSVKDVLDIFPKNENQDFQITKRQGERLFIFIAINQLDVKNISYVQLLAAVQSGIYLEYDAYKSDFKMSILQKSLLEIIENIDTLKGIYNSYISNYDNIMKLKITLNPDNKSAQEKIYLSSGDINIMLAIQAIRCHYNIIDLCRFLFASLKDSKEYEYPNLYNKKIFEVSMDDILFPRLSSEEIYNYLVPSN